MTMGKSHVSMESFVCPVTGVTHSHGGGILFDRRLKDSMEPQTVVGYKYCEKVEKKIEEGYVPLIEINNNKADGDKIKLGEANRTGRIFYMKKEALEEMIGKEVYTDFTFIDVKMGAMLQSKISIPIADEN